MGENNYFAVLCLCIHEYIVVSLILEDRSILAKAEAPAGFVSVPATTQIFLFSSLL